MTKFSVVIPTRNEIQNLPFLIPYTQLFDEVIFVDGMSKDGTRSEIQQLFPTAKLIHQEPHIGKGSAICIGLLNATKDFVFVLDADSPVSLKEIEQAKKILSRNMEIDLLKTSRHLNEGGSEDLTGIRRIGAIFFAALTRKLFKVDWTEMCYGFWSIKVACIRRLSLPNILEYRANLYPFHKIPYGASFEFDQLLFLRSYKLGFKIEEIPSFELQRVNGESSLFAPFDGLRTFITILFERFHK